MKIPNQLQSELPFASKPKVLGKRSRKTYETKRAVVLDGHEKQVYALMQRANTIRNDKVEKAQAKKQQQLAVLVKRRQKEDAVREAKAREDRKKIFRAISQQQQRREKRQKHSEM